MSPSPADASLGTVPPEPTDHLRRSTPDGRVYWEQATFERELDQFFYRNWLCVGRDEEFPNPGDYGTRAIGGESLLLVRDDQHRLNAFHNLCRHRGTQVVLDGKGSGARSFACPYHSWVYGLDGRLLGAPHTRELEGFRREENGLYPVKTEHWGGFVWVNFDREAAPLKESFGRFFAKMARFDFSALRLGARKVYDVQANWKILVENYSECYHCAPVHPSLNRLTPYLSGDNDAYFHEGSERTRVSGGFMEFTKDFQSMTLTGYTKRPPLHGMTETDRHRVYYHTLFPNLFFSVHPDYLMIHRTWPQSPSRSVVENEFYFDEKVVGEAGFDPSDAVDLWDEVNRQDWFVCELAQKGARSRAWHGGRYSEQETLVADFDRYVEEELRRSP